MQKEKRNDRKVTVTSGKMKIVVFLEEAELGVSTGIR